MTDSLTSASCCAASFERTAANSRCPSIAQASSASAVSAAGEPQSTTAAAHSHGSLLSAAVWPSGLWGRNSRQHWANSVALLFVHPASSCSCSCTSCTTDREVLGSTPFPLAVLLASSAAAAPTSKTAIAAVRQSPRYQQVKSVPLHKSPVSKHSIPEHEWHTE